MTQPGFPGAHVPPNSAAVDLLFDMDIPATIEKTHYLLCMCLITFSGWFPWKIFDRKITVFEIT